MSILSVFEIRRIFSLNLNTELEIKKGLEEKKSSLHIAKELFLKMKFKETPLPQKEKLINFCINAGLYQMAFNIFHFWLKKKETFPFAQWIELLNLKIKKPKQKLISSLIEGAKKENLEFELTRSNVWDAFEPKINQIRTQAFKKYKNLLENKKNLLKEKLIFFKSQQMIKEEKKILKELYTLFPKDPDLPEYAKDFSERWSSNILSQPLEQKISSASFLEKKKSKSHPSFQWIKNHVFEKAKKNPKKVYDFSLLFYFMGKYSEAYEILNYTTSNGTIAFYSIEILIQSSRYFEALEAIEKIKNQYPSNEEMPFLATYLKAQALSSLGYKTQAIQLLKQIVEIRPDFRSARYFIEEWSHS